MKQIGELKLPVLTHNQQHHELWETARQRAGIANMAQFQRLALSRLAREVSAMTPAELAELKAEVDND